MVRAHKNLGAVVLTASLGLLLAGEALGQQDPPSRVARLNYINGSVSMEPAGIEDWAPADINRPFSIGDYLYTDRRSVAELHLDVAAIRMAELTSFGILNLNDQTVQIKLTEGDLYLRIHNFGENQVFEVDTPNAAITLLRDGVYRIHVDPNANTTFVVARRGQAEITGGGQAFTLNPGDSASLSGTDQLAYNVQPAPQPDAFDNWCGQRDTREEHLASARYLPPTLIGYEDLDTYGDWTEAPDYGPVWYPRRVDAGWAPYHYGHWVWIEPWGWTWVDDAPWGFAPFHYGRWVYWHERWGWAPGPIAVVYHGPVVRPVYAPALVAWFGGSHWGVSITAGPSLGWVALGFGEVFTPHYACSRPYFTNVNVYNTRIVKTVNITNVYETVYVKKTVYDQTFVNVHAPHAVIAMPQGAFASGRAVHQAGFAVRETDIVNIREAHVLVPPVAPTRMAVAPALGRPVSRPDVQIIRREVIARNVPPQQPVAFAQRQAYLQQHAGEPHNFAAMHQAIAPQPRPVAFVRQASEIRQGQARPGAPAGNAPRPQALERGRNGQQQFNAPANQTANQAGRPAYQMQQQAVQPRYGDGNRHQGSEQVNQPRPPEPQNREAPVQRPQQERRYSESEQPHQAARPPEPPRAAEHQQPPTHQESRPPESPRGAERQEHQAHQESHPPAAQQESHHESRHEESPDQKDTKK